MEFDIDSGAYIAMAEGKMAEVLRPFANRVLGPMIVGALKSLGLNTDTAFLLLHAAAALVFVGAIAWLLKRRGCGWKTLPLLVAPWLFRLGYDIYLPDLLVASLTALFFVALERQRKGLAFLLLVPMMLARESSMIVAGVLVALAVWDGWRTRTWRTGEIVLPALALVVGMGLAGWLSRESPGNINGLGGLVYMPVKAVANAVFSFTGVQPWNDVYGRELTRFYTHEPIWRMACPVGLRFGRFTEVGIYEWHPWQIVTTLKIMFLGFGALSLYAAGKLRSAARRATPEAEWLRVAFWVGLAFWALTPISGFSPQRYVGYAWPLMWLWAAPRLASEPPRRYWTLLAAHAALVFVIF